MPPEAVDSAKKLDSALWERLTAEGEYKFELILKG